MFIGKSHFRFAAGINLLGLCGIALLLQSPARGADVMIAPSGQPVEICGLDSPQPDTIRYDDGGSYYLYGPANLWGCVRFTAPQDFELRCIYVQMLNNHNVSNGVQVSVRQNSGGQPGALISGPYRFPGPLWIGGIWLDVELDQPFPTFGAGQDFMVVLGPAPTGPPTQGWFLYFDNNGNTENRSGYATSQSGPYNFQFLIGDLIVRAGGEFNPATPSVSLDLIPVVTPVIIPALGGSFSFYVNVSLNDSISQMVQLWSDALMPDNRIAGPLFGPATVNLAPGVTAWWRTQYVPSPAPAGNYLYRGYVGAYPTTVFDSDSFAFQKTAGGDGEITREWSNWGDEFLEKTPTASAITKEFTFCKNYPNPFNPTTTFRFALLKAGRVELTVYGISGRQVAKVADGLFESGWHEAAFDGSDLASGVYIYRIKAGQNISCGKILLIK